jgi:hypothetical protein
VGAKTAVPLLGGLAAAAQGAAAQGVVEPAPPGERAVLPAEMAAATAIAAVSVERGT